MEHKVTYNDSNHTYWAGGIRYLSATQIVDHFKNKFNKEEAASEYARRHGGTAGDWLAAWEIIRDRSLDRGNQIHQRQEDIVLSSGLVSFEGQSYMVPNPALLNRHEYQSWPDGAYPELLLWSHEYQIAGRTDLALFSTRGRNRVMDIEDYKTNKFIRTHSYKDKLTGYRMMRGPVSHLMDCEFYQYALQLSLYQFMGEYLGFKAGNRTLIHYPHIPDMAPEGALPPGAVRIPVPYLRTEVVAMMKSLVYLVN